VEGTRRSGLHRLSERRMERIAFRIENTNRGSHQEGFELGE